jgi:CheY-like chemotaxis protein
LALSDAPVGQARSSSALASPARPAAVRVLAVDDDPTIGNVVRRVVRSEGHSVTTVASAEDALSRLRTESFDILISDLGLVAD